MDTKRVLHKEHVQHSLRLKLCTPYRSFLEPIPTRFGFDLGTSGVYTRPNKTTFSACKGTIQ
ncbi:MAG: hypothetical protein IJ527_06820, partial [Prevotella sp.]|nr:hypothetical protein [Prevotella sp.]